MTPSDSGLSDYLFSPTIDYGEQLIGQLDAADETAAAQHQANVSTPPSQWADYARQAANAYGIPADTFVNQMEAESGLNPYNADGSVKTSSAGAIGIAQLMPSTAQNLGVDPTNPQQSLMGAASLMRSYLDRTGGNMSQALAMYNAGPGVDMKNLPSETQDYISKILGGDPGIAHLATQAMAAGAMPQDVQWAMQNLDSQSFINYCERFVEQANSVSGKYATAADAYSALSGQYGVDKPQTGDLAYFAPDASNGNAGHAAIITGYASNGTPNMISATSNGVQQGNVLDWMKATGQRLLGFIRNPWGGNGTPSSNTGAGGLPGAVPMPSSGNPATSNAGGDSGLFNTLTSDWNAITGGGATPPPMPNDNGQGQVNQNLGDNDNGQVGSTPGGSWADSGPAPFGADTTDRNQNAVTPISTYNQETPQGGWEQVQRMASGDYQATPIAPDQYAAQGITPDSQAAYEANEAATSGFTSPDIGAPLLSGSAPGAQQAPITPTPPAQAQGPGGFLGDVENAGQAVLRSAEAGAGAVGGAFNKLGSALAPLHDPAVNVLSVALTGQPMNQQTLDQAKQEASSSQNGMSGYADSNMVADMVNKGLNPVNPLDWGQYIGNRFLDHGSTSATAS